MAYILLGSERGRTRSHSICPEAFLHAVSLRSGRLPWSGPDALAPLDAHSHPRPDAVEAVDPGPVGGVVDVGPALPGKGRDLPERLLGDVDHPRPPLEVEPGRLPGDQ